MDSTVHIPPGKVGTWSWDEINNGLIYITRDMHLRTPSVTNTNITIASKQTIINEIKFKDTTDALEQIRFRRHCQRKCKPNEVEIVTIQDVKDVVLFMSNPKQLSVEFINYFHLPTMDRFLRALIVYFQYYFQIWEKMMVKREEEKRKLRQPYVTVLENIVRDNLSDLRSLVAREYCSILIGAEDTKIFHHMKNNRNNDSLSDKDRRLFETLISIAARVVWIALQRKYFSLIELELNRLLRTNIFNIIVHRGVRGGNIFQKTQNEERVLTGTAEKEVRKLLRRSPALREIVHADHDYRLLICGFRDYEPRDERMDYLEAAFVAPEEMLLDLGVTVGVLGIPRNEVDAMLMPKERSGRHAKPPRELPEFKIPSVTKHNDDDMQKTFPKKPCKYTETLQTTKARITQAKMWRKYVRKAAELYDMSIIDLTATSASRTGIMQSKPSILTLLT